MISVEEYERRKKAIFDTFDTTRIKELDDEIMNMSVEDLKLAVRSTICLHNAGIDTLGQLLVMTEQELIDSGHFGTKVLNNIKYHLWVLGLELYNTRTKKSSETPSCATKDQFHYSTKPAYEEEEQKQLSMIGEQDRRFFFPFPSMPDFKDIAALHAMQGMISRGERDPEHVAKLSYEFADAMMKHRNRTCVGAWEK